MLNRVDMINKQGQILPLPFGDGDQGYFIDEIDGLDPVKATIVTTSSANVDGTQYQASRREGRDLVFKMAVDTSQSAGSVSQLRRKLMGFAMPKSEVTLRFYADDFPVVEIVGIVETFDWPLFVAEPEVTLTIQCGRPDFYELTSVVLSGTTTPTPSDWAVDYDGSTETGFLFRMPINRALSEFTIYHRSASNIQSSFEFAESLVAGDVVEISTITGAKGVWLTRNGTRSSILFAKSPYSNWINLFTGTNYIGVVAGGAGLPFTIEYVTKHGGL